LQVVVQAVHLPQAAAVLVVLEQQLVIQFLHLSQLLSEQVRRR
jgi:hypothetical protein